MKKCFLILFYIFFSLITLAENLFAKEMQKINFKYKFSNSKLLEKNFPFLKNNELLQNFTKIQKKEYDSENQLKIAKFNFNNNQFYVVLAEGFYFCNGSGCSFEIFSKKDNKVVLTGRLFGNMYIDEIGTIYSQYNIGDLGKSESNKNKEQELDYKYTFKNSKKLEETFPFLINTGVFEGFKEYEPIATEQNWVNDMLIAEFEYNNNKYYMVYGGGTNFCGSNGCYFEVFSKKDNRVIIKNHFYVGGYLSKDGKLYFQYDLGKIN